MSFAHGPNPLIKLIYKQTLFFTTPDNIVVRFFRKGFVTNKSIENAKVSNVF